VSHFNWVAATPEERRAHWVAKLRSGEYQQCQGVLKTDSGFCCLGVLCDIYDDTRWNNENMFVFGGEGCDNWPPAEILNDVGLDRAKADVLASANDDDQPFSTIADIIEQGKYFDD
jgi:hypothetical protein